MQWRMGCAIALMSAALGWCTPGTARELQGVTIAEHAEVKEWALPLRLSGAALVYRRYLPFHTVALYLALAKVDPQSVPKGMAPCRIAVHWLTPELDADAAAAYWRGEFDKLLDDPLTRERLRGSIERVITAFGTAKRDDELVLDYHPDRGLRVTRNGTPVGSFAGLELNRLVLGLWLGPHVAADVRAVLLEGANPPAASQ